jgi:hypothetical protein
VLDLLHIVEEVHRLTAADIGDSERTRRRERGGLSRSASITLKVLTGAFASSSLPQE